MIPTRQARCSKSVLPLLVTVGFCPPFSPIIDPNTAPLISNLLATLVRQELCPHNDYNCPINSKLISIYLPGIICIYQSFDSEIPVWMRPTFRNNFASLADIVIEYCNDLFIYVQDQKCSQLRFFKKKQYNNVIHVVRVYISCFDEEEVSS